MESRRTDWGARLSTRRPAQFRSSKPRTVVIVQPDALLREALVRFMCEFGFASVIGEAAQTAEAIELIDEKRPDLILIDVRDSVLDGLSVCKAALRQSVRPRVIFCTDIAHAATYHNRIFKAGASGLILQNAPFYHWLYVMGLFPLDSRCFKEDYSTFVDSQITKLLKQNQQLASGYVFSKTELATLIRLRMRPSHVSEEIDLALPMVKGLQENIQEALGARSNSDAAERAEALGYKLLRSPDTLDEAARQEATCDAVRRLFEYIDDHNKESR